MGDTMDPNSPETIIGMLAVVLIPVISALVIKLQKISPQLKKAQVGVTLFVKYGQVIINIFENLELVIAALDAALEDGKLTDAEAADIVKKGQPIITQGKQLLNNPAIADLKELIEDYK